MNNYFQYLGELLKAFFINLGNFFYDFIIGPWSGNHAGSSVGSQFSHYGTLLSTYSPSFGFGGWFFFIIFLLAFIALIGAICFFLFIALKKYVHFVKREIDKEELQRQVERLNYELYKTIQEKDRILALKTGGYGDLGNMSQEDQDTVGELTSRFAKLTYVDNQYAGKDMSIPEIPNLTLEEVCNSFRQFASANLHLYYTIDTIRQLFAGMATSKLILLEGISGTGKTSMPYALGKFLKHDAAICSVQPSWKDRSELLGYYNEFTKKFNETEFLRALYDSMYRKDCDLIVLDELNLARVEYYFAEFLSIMEMPDKNEWKVELINSYAKNDPKLVVKGKILIPQNVFFFGTANNDDSTFTISDKVYDRAISLFFDNKGIAFEAQPTDPMVISYEQLSKLFEESKTQYPVSQKLLEKFDELDTFVINNFRLAFGNRILKQLYDFIPAYVACGGSDLDGLDFIFTNKVLKKFESLNIGFLKNELNALNGELDKLFGPNSFRMAHKYIANLIKMS